MDKADDDVEAVEFIRGFVENIGQQAQRRGVSIEHLIAEVFGSFDLYQTSSDGVVQVADEHTKQRVRSMIIYMARTGQMPETVNTT